MYNNFEKSKEFEKYKQLYPNLLDLTSFPTYGLVNHRGQPVCVKPEMIGYSTKFRVALQKDVLSNFEEMMEYILEVRSKNLVPNSFINNFVPVSQYLDRRTTLSSTLKDSIDRFRVYVNRFHKSWRNFSEFSILWAGGGRHARAVPTFDAEKIRVAGIALPSVVNSGLSWGISPMMKRTDFFSDVHFSFFHDACKHFGFFINFHSPNQLIFNVNHDSLKKPLDRFFGDGYNLLIHEELINTFSELSTVYSILLEENPYYTEIKICNGKTIIDLIEKEKTPKVEDVDLKKLYLDQHININKIPLNDSEYNRVLKILHVLPETEAVEYVLSLTQKTK